MCYYYQARASTTTPWSGTRTRSAGRRRDAASYNDNDNNDSNDNNDILQYIK